MNRLTHSLNQCYLKTDELDYLEIWHANASIKIVCFKKLLLSNIKKWKNESGYSFTDYNLNTCECFKINVI